ncbi:MAG: UDP-2,3-diacylglucosamine diphosphatase [Betaproteobacteria bacterium]|nr:UDP-2,3-diacylglucosamine diphosphatase [Betaproteobacteria bacterium]
MPLAELAAPPGWRSLCIISDLHLSADEPGTLRAFSRFVQQLAHDADCSALFVLGDLFDVWIGDDRPADAASRAVLAAFGQLAAARKPVWLMHGNRDFLLADRFLALAQAQPLHDPTVLVFRGHRIALAHGDSLCTGDLPYQQFRAMVRNPAWQHAFLARPIDERERMARQIRSESERNKRTVGLTDVQPDAVLQLMQAAHAPVLVHGHTHEGRSHRVAGLAGWPDAQRHVLSDWHAHTHRPRGDALWVTPRGVERRSVY